MTTDKAQIFTSPVQCPFDHDDIGCDMILYYQMGNLLDHLESCHGIKVERPHELIYVIQQYLEHYALRLESSSLTSSTIFNLGGDDRQSDSNLRFDLQNAKLKQMLAIQQQERLDKKSDFEWSDFNEDLEESALQTACLFCNYVAPDPQQLLSHHLPREHSFNLTDLSARFYLSLYDKIKLINYLRRQQLVNGDCPSQTQANADIERLIMDNKEWRDVQYLLPTYEDDPIFMALEDGEDDALNY